MQCVAAVTTASQVFDIHAEITDKSLHPHAARVMKESAEKWEFDIGPRPAVRARQEHKQLAHDPGA
jgi:hypothetical protein